jgi:hypothetical protein
MSDRPTDPIDPIDPADPFEGRLHARVRAYSQHGVRPIDAAAIAHDASAGARAGLRRPALRLGAAMALGVAAVAFVVVAASVMLPGGDGLTGVGAGPTATPGAASGEPSSGDATTPEPQSPSPASGTPSPVTCELTASITSWTGAAGHRIASVRLVNEGAPCHVSSTARVELVDANGTVLLRGPAAGSGDVLTLGTGGVLTTEVDDDNYCGDIPIPPVTLVFVWPNGTRTVAEPAPATSIDGVPPCNGDPGSAGHITMQPWRR